MLGKAKEIKHELLGEYTGRTIWDEIEDWKVHHPNAVVLDISFAIMTNGENVNEVYREALIIYKEDTP